ncbi:hypothetical protein CVT26_015026 [Gymnopilus dilepis]|uniref:Uncharacterized protein n=1 Tax=Gymnopilus dilepis TaxID=231916 RepID=A0A409YNR0_9AGAR|nr:hypothetical protein CVT26_015026 [Gymnopilus dilepis]
MTVISDTSSCSRHSPPGTHILASSRVLCRSTPSNLPPLPAIREDAPTISTSELRCQGVQHLKAGSTTVCLTASPNSQS